VTRVVRGPRRQRRYGWRQDGAVRAVRALVVAACTVCVGAPAANAASWHLDTVPSPAPARLAAVSCTSVTMCMAVGRTGSERMVSLKEGSGGWTEQHMAYLSGGAHPNAIACPTANDCVVVGDYFEPQDSGLAGFGQSWNGTSWSLGKIPRDFANGTPELDAVTCANADFCLAAGDSASQGMGSLDTAATVRWNGSQWSRQKPQPPSPATDSGDGAANQINGISCASTASCMTIGLSTNTNPDVRCSHCNNMAEHFDGRAWVYAPTARTNAQAIACPSATECVAVGGSVAQVWNGRTWKVTTLTGVLRAISCPTTMTCVAVGNAGGATLVERWNGKTWSTQPTPRPPGHRKTRPDGISCATPESCVLVGSYATFGGTSALLESYS
jgi:hypothetical protein